MLFNELKRRNVIRVGIAYAVAAWVLLQVADLVLESIEAPGWVLQAMMLAIALGFIVSIIIAWAYELTPEGIKRERDVTRGDSVTHETGPVSPPEEAVKGPSIAVLPFVNMSDDPAQVYFSDGISEELLNVLAGVDGLSVASRTFSSFDTVCHTMTLVRSLPV
jgi:hypothetical protein